MPVLTGSWLLYLLLDQMQDTINIANEDLPINNGCHTADTKEALASVLVVGLPDIIDDARDGIFE